jgi:NAD-dependent dihydropyrimidine dehydrogenase PreA subunit
MNRGLKYLRGVTTLELDQALCIGCGVCEVVCPQAVFEMAVGVARIRDRDACMECGACALNCESGALSVSAGVGCAAAVINAALGRSDACCCAVSE